MENFESLDLPDAIRISLKQMNFSTPTPIQAKSIPPALEGKDILGSAQTGTGKTAAFGVPLVNHLIKNGKNSALIMTPTRELAMQVKKTLEDIIGKTSGIKAALLIGGEPMPKQMKELRARPRLIVGTPGRINDHIERGNLMLMHTDFLVLDETDRMLDMGFEVQINKVVKFLPPKRQTLLFSATLPKNIVKMSERYLKNPVRISVDPETVAAPKIKQEVLHVEAGGKFEELTRQLEEREGSVIVFVKTKWNTKKIADRLERKGYSAEAIHGDLTQNTRARVIKGFRDEKYRVLIATDIAARGLDIPHIEHVINYDLPQVPEDYIHRIGRTARAGAEGSSLCFLTSDDRAQWKEICKLLDPSTMPEADFGPRSASDSKSKSSRSRNGGGGQKRYSSNGGKGRSSYKSTSSDGKKSGGKKTGGDKKSSSKAGAKNSSSRRRNSSSKKGLPKFSGRKLDIS